MKKIFTLAITVLSVFTLSILLSLTAYASEPILAQGNETEETTEENDSKEAVITTEKSDTGADLNKENPFTEIYETAIANADKILSALAFVSSLALVFFYKRGLLPLLSKALTSIKNSAGGFETIAKEGAIKTEETLNFLLDKFAYFENSVNGVLEAVEKLDETMRENGEEKSDRKKLKSVMLSQVDMLYDIFMQSSLPQYSKDAVGERVAEMKAALSDGEAND